MKNNNFFTFLLSLAILSLFTACSSTKYGAHFSPSTHHSQLAEKTRQVDQKNEGAIAQQEKAGDEIALQAAKRAGAVEVHSDVPSKEITLKKIITEAEMPGEEELSVQQQEVLQTVKERLQNMSRQEKKALKREVRKIRLAEYTKNLPSYGDMDVNDVQQNQINTLLLVIITIFIPPLGVFLHQGVINNKFWISLLLTLLLYVPGLIYSLIVVLGD